MWKPTICRAFSGRDTVPHLLRVPSQIIWATAKFRFMESSIYSSVLYFLEIELRLGKGCLSSNSHIFLLTNTSSVFGSKGICIYTSSTAQGAGGSFKNRKPIGEIGCCESGMAKRTHWWTERCLRSPLFLSLSLTIYLPINLSSMYLSIDLSISLFLSFI